MLERLLSRRRFGVTGNLEAPFSDLYEDLLQRDVLEPLAYEAVADLRGSRSGLNPSYGELQVAVGGRLGGMMRGVDRAAGLLSGSVIALVGPTGVGKTTTLAKLAAHHRVAAGRSVAIVSIDTYRIAAVEQLKRYADIIGVPCEVALTPADLGRALERYRDADFIFLDTTGRSPRDGLGIGEIRSFLSVARRELLSAVRPMETHLVLSVTAKGDDLLETARRFAPLEPDRLTFTKIDETQSYGHLLNVSVLTDLPVAYLTTGQEVPDDIEEAGPERIAQLVVFGGS
jgi:flagellar biosynthesis protein FlhF